MRYEIIPNLRYADAPKAIEFLCDAFGFERHAVYLNEVDPKIVEHAQLVWGDRMVMVASINDSEFARAARMTTPTVAGGPTMGLYLMVEDVDSHAARARAAGATIILGPSDQGYGGRGYSALDPEGNVWSFGNYDPWAPPPNE
ncbi:VOC family protein [Devosia algicola]|uniref:VOC family protein n=1 Tax=Devosia algicola TaxID=3026418 RepID=A0ABY7YLH3_9HYPH|nr:VOC family protein [Devosia algicola]WDR02151.1 VOC family protein [Devosia algicola]